MRKIGGLYKLGDIFSTRRYANDGYAYAPFNPIFQHQRFLLLTQQAQILLCYTNLARKF